MHEAIFTDMEDAETKKKTHEIDGRSFNLTKKDPYGHWYVTLPSGAPPKELSGVYTSEHDAIKAIDHYASKKKVTNGNSSS